MLFNSFSFVAFFVVVTTLFFALPHAMRWLLLLLASCFFYMCFVPIYILILAATIVIDYFAAIWIEEAASQKKKKLYLTASIVSVCAILFVFKYFNFFNDNFAALAAALHWNYPIEALRIALPIGLSFHTFQSLSYVVEVYRGNQKAERHFGIYALFVMYFPQLVAGPIERPINLLHQFRERKYFDLARFQDGCTLILWGLFKKVVVADSLAIYVDTIYGNSAHHNGATLLLATYCFAFQIYCDFSGYSDIARGVSRIYGIELMKNFDTPYFSRSISEFWTRWHISLSTWFRDYVYIPLGGNRVSFARNSFNLMVVFLLSGFWHGANWTFIIWGGIHGIYLIVERLWKLGKERFGWVSSGRFQLLRSGLSGLLVFHLVVISWVFFRAKDVASALDIARRMMIPTGPIFFDPILVQCFLGVAIVVASEWLVLRSGRPAIAVCYPIWLRYSTYMAMLFGISLFGVEKGSQFIYFQF